MNVKFQPSGVSCFQISFHLPFFAWRSKVLTDRRLGAEGRPLRKSIDISFLCDLVANGEAHVHEALFSCMVAGVDNRHWTVYGFFDTYHDGSDSKHDVRFYEPASDEIPEDPLTGGRYASDRPLFNAREYYLRIMMCCVAEVKSEWQNTGKILVKALKPYTSNDEDANWRMIQNFTHKIVRLLEQIHQALYGTVSAWERFQEHDLPFFDLENWTNSAARDPRIMVKHIENDIRELRVLGETLALEAARFKSVTAERFTLNKNKERQRTNILVTAGSSLLPFVLMMVLPSAPILRWQLSIREAMSAVTWLLLITVLLMGILNTAKATYEAGGFLAYLQQLRPPKIDSRLQIGKLKGRPRWWSWSKDQQLQRLKEPASDEDRA
ncbi:hypothetical protein QBC40DRAFT_301885 [Triangularia verruculosa]|uniref:Uncharacterized protein n=1 Tax=Triangularia verruculosa TaxID=2587418 RepID=A0AAN6X765_9PEZI|nr:hypothetical protein QBC40DRAFT_301885 [Triangularia verruculosa]